MPGMDGFEVLKQIRANPALKGMTVIALTALAMDGDYERGIAAGFDGYITKPIDVGNLMSQINRIVEAKEANEPLS